MKIIIVDKDGAETTLESSPGEWCYVEYSPSFKARGLKDGWEKIVMPQDTEPPK